MCKIISVVNPKGGAAKTTSAINIAYALKNRGKKVLVIDADPRGAVGIYLQLQNDFSLYDLCINSFKNILFDYKNYIIEKNGVDFIKSSSKLKNLELTFTNENSPQAILFIIREIIDPIRRKYDFIIFDTEGTTNALNTGILNATDYIFIPTQISQIDLNGVGQLFGLLKDVKRMNRRIKVGKFFLVRVKTNTNLFKETLNNFLNDENVMKNAFTDIYIREDMNLANGMKVGKDIFTYKKSSNSAIDYKNLVNEFLKDLEVEKNEK